MKSIKFMYWKDGDTWLGYLQEYPDYMTQGESLDELKQNLREIHADLTSGLIPCARHLADLDVA